MICDAKTQTRLLCALAADKELFVQNVDKLRLSDFPSVSVRIVFEVMKLHWQRYGEVPGTMILPGEVMDAVRGTGPDGQTPVDTVVPNTSFHSVAECIGSVVTAMGHKDTKDTAYFRDKLKEYLSTVRLGAMPGSAMNASEQLEAAAKIREEVEQITGGERKGLSTSARKRIVKRRGALPERFGTGVWPIDIRMKMGLELGELACVLAPSGAGKSNVLVNIAANTALRGQRCLFITLELSEDIILRRLHAMMGNFPMSLMDKPEEEWPKRELERYDYMLESIPNVDYVTVNYEYVDKTATCDDIDREIGSWRKALRDDGVSDSMAPMVCIDYIRQIDSGKLAGKNDNTNTKFGAIMQQLKRMAMKHHCVIWTAQQVTRAANHKEHIRKDDIADSIAIVNHCDALLGFVPVGDGGQTDPTTEETEEDTAAAHADKERLMNVDFVKLRNSGETGSFCTVFQGKSLRLWTSESYARVAENMAATAPFDRYFATIKPKEAK